MKLTLEFVKHVLRVLYTFDWLIVERQHNFPLTRSILRTSIREGFLKGNASSVGMLIASTDHGALHFSSLY
jgi:hypothetical protein